MGGRIVVGGLVVAADPFRMAAAAFWPSGRLRRPVGDGTRPGIVSGDWGGATMRAEGGAEAGIR